MSRRSRRAGCDLPASVSDAARRFSCSVRRFFGRVSCERRFSAAERAARRFSAADRIRVDLFPARRSVRGFSCL
ncbi:hypothetical protein NDU88_001354 [Pleurodeles waltl]|uniref:Uncharacterized protein n=1 Tax=Pleurodeles waltl TaxID=8319 RepID=A0AAV7LXE8_PLEWA|nr:hypothetical protein NDU88_001354 [Pleurodeles waltl]